MVSLAVYNNNNSASSHFVYALMICIQNKVEHLLTWLQLPEDRPTCEWLGKGPWQHLLVEEFQRFMLSH